VARASVEEGLALLDAVVFALKGIDRSEQLVLADQCLIRLRLRLRLHLAWQEDLLTERQALNHRDPLDLARDVGRNGHDLGLDPRLIGPRGDAVRKSVPEKQQNDGDEGYQGPAPDRVGPFSDRSFFRAPASAAASGLVFAAPSGCLGALFARSVKTGRLGWRLGGRTPDPARP
jgi:hypothetical protein